MLTRRHQATEPPRPRELTTERTIDQAAADLWLRSQTDPVLDPTERVMIERAICDLEHVLRADDDTRVDLLELAARSVA